MSPARPLPVSRPESPIDHALMSAPVLGAHSILSSDDSTCDLADALVQLDHFFVLRHFGFYHRAESVLLRLMRELSSTCTGGLSTPC